MEVFNKRILLNSHSPRRKQILEDMGFQIKIVSSDCEELYPKNLSPEQVAMFLAKKKGESYTGKIESNEILLSADTIVVLDNTVLGKPNSEKDAISMLKNLGNREHKVITGCYLKTNQLHDNFFEETNVIFAPLTEEEICYYVREKQPLDKAGAYGIQEWIGMVGIKAIKGDYYNVMGLPSCKLWQRLKLL